jgi:DNA-binding response OmpR family regulator
VPNPQALRDTPPPADAYRSTPRRADLRIALLEDDTELRELILLPGLRDFGFNAIGLASAAELHALLATQHFDILVLDVGLPDQDGFAVTRQLRASSAIGIIMLTGRGGTDSGDTPSPNGWRLDANGWCLIAPGGGMVALTMAERRVLGELVAATGEAVNRETLIAALTPDIYDFDPHRLETLVHRLRRKVTEGTGEALPLRAVHGVGYVLV